MRKPPNHALTAEDRAAFKKWLIRVSVFYVSVALFTLGCVIAGPSFTKPNNPGTAALTK